MSAVCETLVSLRQHRSDRNGERRNHQHPLTFDVAHRLTGHTIAISDGAQAIVNRYAYAPYGKLLAKQKQISQPFTYVGQYGVMSEANNVYYMRARYYDAEVGRFISEDPIGFAGGVNLYAYVGGNPVMLVDPSGLKTFSEYETSGFFVAAQKQTLWEAFENHRGGGRFDFAYGPNSNDIWIISGKTYNAHEFGNILAGYTGGFNFGESVGGAIVVLAGTAANIGDNGLSGDLDASSRPYISLGAQLGASDASTGHTQGGK